MSYRHTIEQETRDLRWPMTSGAFFLFTAVLFSCLPRVRWIRDQLFLESSPYKHFTDLARWSSIVTHGDVGHYLYLATNGYPRGLVDHVAFFPLFPWILGGVHMVLHCGSEWLALLALPINFMLWTGAVLTWREVVKDTPCFDMEFEHALAESRFVWFIAFYPTVVFNFVAYPESLLLLLAGLALRAAQTDRFLALALVLPPLVFTMPIGVAVGASVVAWMLVFRVRHAWLPLLTYAFGLWALYQFFSAATGDPWSWWKVLTSKSALPTLPLDAYDLVLGAAYLVVGPIWLVVRMWRTGKKEPNHWLALVYMIAVLGSVGVAGAMETSYRIVYLVPFLLALPACALRGSGWGLFAKVVLLLNLLATYRFVVGLHHA